MSKNSVKRINLTLTYQTRQNRVLLTHAEYYKAPTTLNERLKVKKKTKQNKTKQNKPKTNKQTNKQTGKHLRERTSAGKHENHNRVYFSHRL